MSAKADPGGPVTRSRVRAKHLPAVDELMIPPPSRRVRIIRRKSELRAHKHPFLRTDCPGGLIRVGDEISKLSTDGSLLGKYICRGESHFYAKRFNGKFKRLLQFVLRGSGGYESKYYAEDDPAISIIGSKRFTSRRRVATRSRGPPAEPKANPGQKAARELARLGP